MSLSILGACFETLVRLRHRRLTMLYRKRLKRFPEYSAPLLYNDKIQWRKLFDRNPLFPLFLDKIAVRGHVERTAPELKLPALLWSGADPDAIPVDALPGRCVIKPNCRSGANHFVLSRADLDPALVLALCRQWLARPYGQAEKQWGYRHVERRILVEEFLDSHPERDHTRDFRFHVFDGRVQLITVADCRIDGAERKLLGVNMYYDRDWRQLPYVNTRFQSAVPEGIPRPPPMDAMVAAAEKLGSGIDHLRVDLYLVNGDIYFGELTVYPLSGLGAYALGTGAGNTPVEDYEVFLGRPWRLPRISKLTMLYRGLVG